jgi:hypothetical protein
MSRARPVQIVGSYLSPKLHRAALAEIGAPLTSDAFGTANPRRGVMRV